MSEIIDNKLFLGDMFDANNESKLKEKNISCVICVAEDIVIRLNDPTIKVYKYNLQDTYDCDISLYFDEISDLIHKEGVVLVNCAAGISRSSTIVIAYLMKYYDIKLRDALVYVKDNRSVICPNKRFLKYLFEYEKKIFGENKNTWEEISSIFYF